MDTMSQQMIQQQIAQDKRRLELEGSIQKNNFFSLLKSFFSPLFKQRFFYQNETYEILLTEEEYSNPVKKQLKFAKLWIVDYTNEVIPTSVIMYKNILEYLFVKKLSLITVLKLLKSIGNRYKAGLAQFWGFIEHLPYPLHLKKKLLETQNLVLVLKEYDFTQKDDMIKRLEALQDRPTKDRGEEYIQIAEEISMDITVKKKIKSSFIQPAIYIVLIIITIVFFNTKFFPIMLQLATENPKVLTNVTQNPIYILYNGFIDNWIIITIFSVLWILALYLLMQIQIVKEYWQALLIKTPIVRDMIKYREFNRFLSIIITYYNSRLKQAVLHSYLNAWPIFYCKTLYTADKTVVVDELLKYAVNNNLFPLEPASNLLSIMASWDVYSAVWDMREIKKETLVWYEEAVKKFVSIIQWIILLISFVAIGFALNGAYGTLYGMITDFL